MQFSTLDALAQKAGALGRFPPLDTKSAGVCMVGVLATGDALARGAATSRLSREEPVGALVGTMAGAFSGGTAKAKPPAKRNRTRR